MAVSMNKKDEEALAAAGAKYNAATTDAERDAAHKEAEAIRAKYNYSGGEDGSEHISLDTSGSKSTGGNKATGGQYVGTGAGDTYYRNLVNMSAEDQEAMDKWGDMYNNAASEAEKEYAHRKAEEIRAKYNYSGSTDGSEFIGLPTTQTTGSFVYDKAPTYSDQYSERIDAMLNKLLNRDAFSYDYTQDPLYEQYQKQYTREGERAMQDTLGQVSARTGGLASSWAQTAAQQQQNHYASQAADKIPELYQLAYQMYLNDIDQQVTDLGLLQNMSDTQYNRYRDTMSDWQNDRNFAYGVYRDDISDDRYQNERDYNVGRDQLEDERYDQEWAYQLAQDAVKGSSSGSSGKGSSGTTKPNLTAAQTLSALKGGIVNDTTLAAYKYYYGEDWEENAEDENSLKEVVLRNLTDSVEKNGGLTSAQISQLKNYIAGHMLTEDEVDEILDTLGYWR